MIEKSILHLHIKLSSQLKMLNERSKKIFNKKKKSAHAWEETLLRFCATANFMNETFFFSYPYTNIDLLWNNKITNVCHVSHALIESGSTNMTKRKVCQCLSCSFCLHNWPVIVCWLSKNKFLINVMWFLVCLLWKLINVVIRDYSILNMFGGG